MGKKLNKAIKGLDEVLESGVEWSNQKHKKAHIDLRKWLKELREYRKLKKKGRLLEIPCAIGDTVYVKMQSGKYEEAEVRDFTYFLTCGFCVVVTSDEFGKRNIPFSEFGKTVFLIHQEEEEALARKERGDA